MKPDGIRATRAAQTKARLFAIAREHFERFGYVGADMRTIAKAAGVSTGAIFRYWTGKPQLWRDVMGDAGWLWLFGEAGDRELSS